MATTAPSYVKVVLFLKKRPDITDEKFHNHWRDPHVKIAMANSTFMSKVRRYNQVRAGFLFVMSKSSSLDLRSL
jgi:hypothetical protein